MAITALKLLNEAAKRGWTFAVDQGDDDGPVATRSGAKAWALVKEVVDTHVGFFDADGTRLGWAHLMTPGRNTCSPEETLVDYSVSRTGVKGPFETLCDALIEEVI